jgi:hypothetical protein
MDVFRRCEHAFHRADFFGSGLFGIHENSVDIRLNAVE